MASGVDRRLVGPMTSSIRAPGESKQTAPALSEFFSSHSSAPNCFQPLATGYTTSRNMTAILQLVSRPRPKKKKKKNRPRPSFTAYIMVDAYLGGRLTPVKQGICWPVSRFIHICLKLIAGQVLISTGSQALARVTNQNREHRPNINIENHGWYQKTRAVNCWYLFGGKFDKTRFYLNRFCCLLFLISDIYFYLTYRSINFTISLVLGYFFKVSYHVRKLHGMLEATSEGAIKNTFVK